MKLASIQTLALMAVVHATGALSEGFQSFTATNRNPNRATAIFAMYNGVIPLEYGETHTFEGGRGYNVAVQGNVLYDVSLFNERFELVPREGFDCKGCDIVFSFAQHPEPAEL